MGGYRLGREEVYLPPSSLYEHVWSDDGTFNVEGGCYAKAINLSPDNEPDIFQTVRVGPVLENVMLEDDRSIDSPHTRTVP